MTTTLTDARSAIAAAMPEDELQGNVQTMMTTFSWLWHHAGDWRRSTAGLPDIVAVRAKEGDWRILFAELKREAGKLRRSQVPWMSLLARVAEHCSGHVVVVTWKPSDWLSGEIEKILR